MCLHNVPVPGTTEDSAFSPSAICLVPHATKHLISLSSTCTKPPYTKAHTYVAPWPARVGVDNKPCHGDPVVLSRSTTFRSTHYACGEPYTPLRCTTGCKGHFIIRTVGTCAGGITLQQPYLSEKLMSVLNLDLLRIMKSTLMPQTQTLLPR